MEVCAGSARLSATLQRFGVPTVPVDWDRNRFESCTPTTKIDLTNPNQVGVLLEPIEQGLVPVLCAAPPCGTASRARDIPLKNGRGPKPLRNEHYPRGLPGLSPADTLRVSKANAVYDHLFLLVGATIQQGGHVFIENPLRSWLWEIPQYKQLLNVGFFDITFQNCKWSANEAARNKWSRIRTNMLTLQSLSGPCALKHEHLPWGFTPTGAFATSEEAAYPPGMCMALAQAIVDHLHSFGHGPFVYADQIVVNNLSAHKRRRFASSGQPRGHKIPSLIPQFETVLRLPHDSAISEWHKLLRYEQERGDDGTEQSWPVVGIFRTPQKFVEAAVNCVHPVDRHDTIPQPLMTAICDSLQNPPEDTAKFRTTAIRALLKLIKDTAGDEKTVHESFTAEFEAIVHDKKLVALENLLKKHNWPDVRLVQDIMHGGCLTGLQPYSSVFEFEPTLPLSTVPALRAQSSVNNSAMLAKTVSSGSPDTDLLLWQQTHEELAKGWLSGPFYSVREVSEKLKGEEPHLSRRFGLKQHDKIRAIDDFHESNINSAFGYCDKLDLMDTDSIASTIRYIQCTIASSSCSSRTHDAHANQFCVIHTDWIQDSRVLDWTGSTLDLKAAYKQLPIAPTHLWSSVITIFDPEKCVPAIFIQHTLPFGSTSSVILFNRLSRFLWFIGCVELRAIWLNFYDDFPTLSPAILSKSITASLELLMLSLGWHVADDDKKRLSFQKAFTALGVTFDLTDISNQKACIYNTKKRTEAIVAQLHKVLEAKRLDTKLAESILGKLQFMESYTFGRVGRAYLQCIRAFVGKRSLLDSVDSAQILDLIYWLENSPPRLLEPARSDTVYIFTDGACEFCSQKRTVTCGAIIFFSTGSNPRAFGSEINDALCDEWTREENKSQLVTEAELLPTLLCLRLWSQQLRECKILFFIDSEPAKHSLIRGMSNTVSCSNIVRAFYTELDLLKSFVWFTRVPSISNPADAPSRLDIQSVVTDFGALVDVPLQPKSLMNGVWQT